jgi:hypothetical protein
MKHLSKILIAVMMVMGLSSHRTVTTMGSLFLGNAIDTRTSWWCGWLDQHFLNPSLQKRQLECSSICILHQCI